MSSFISSNDHLFHRFLDHLIHSLDTGTKLRVYHISTPPVPATPIFASPPGQPDEPTTCESHFLTISQPHVITSANVDHTESTNNQSPGKTASHVLVLGIEVLVFSTASLTTVFVSKADSTGFLSRPAQSTQGSASIVKLVISAFLEWLVTRQLSFTASAPADLIDHGLASQPIDHVGSKTQAQGSGRSGGENGRSTRRRRLVLSLFARSQNQYLFPGSIENVTKHVLDDRQLIKWWCRVLDDLVQKDRTLQTTANDGVNLDTGFKSAKAAPSSSSTSVKVSANAYVVVPGCDRTETTRSFFPPSARYPQAENEAKWHNSYPVNLLVQQDLVAAAAPSVPIRCLIPRFPDDPKARYCDDLDGAGTNEKGQWKDIRSLQQFWETMEYRQECAAGRLVGFVWVVFDRIAESSQDELGQGIEASVTHTTNRSETVAADSLVQPQQMHDPTKASLGSVLVTNEQYITLSDLLINTTDFAGAELAVKSTSEWVNKVKNLSDLQDFGIDIEGNKMRLPVLSGQASTSTQITSTTGSKHPRDDSSVVVNVLTGIRKKPKVMSEAPSSTTDSTAIANGHATTSLESVSKTEKSDEKAGSNGSNGVSGVKTLSAGLIRKKPKTVGQ